MIFTLIQKWNNYVWQPRPVDEVPENFITPLDSVLAAFDLNSDKTIPRSSVNETSMTFQYRVSHCFDLFNQRLLIIFLFLSVARTASKS